MLSFINNDWEGGSPVVIFILDAINVLMVISYINMHYYAMGRFSKVNSKRKRSRQKSSSWEASTLAKVKVNTHGLKVHRTA